MIDLSEIFYSIQGESSYSGLPCIFIRLSACNLNCIYCDTQNDRVFSLKAEQILNEIKQYLPVNLVEITGGEPLLQEEVYYLFHLLHQNKYQILLETNGSVLLSKVPDYVVKIVDVKCPGSNEGNSFLIENLKYLLPKDEVKFVLSNHTDFEFAVKFIRNNSINSDKIIFSPVSGKLELKDLAELVLAERLPVKLQMQLHKVIWGIDCRGV